MVFFVYPTNLSSVSGVRVARATLNHVTGKRSAFLFAQPSVFVLVKLLAGDVLEREFRSHEGSGFVLGRDAFRPLQRRQIQPLIVGL